MPRPLTEQQQADAIAMYLDGYSQREVGEHLGITQTGVSTLLQRHGVKTRSRSEYDRPRPLGIGRKLTDDQEAEAARLYVEDRWHQHQVAAQLRVSQSMIGDALKRQGVTARGYREAHTRRALNHEALDVLTPAAMYWCGFIFTDGTVIARPGGQGDLVSLHIGSIDRGHLEKFRTFLGSNHGITDQKAATFERNGRTYTGKPTSIFSVSSQRLADRLRSLGRYEGPIHEELARSRDFWRGAMDGDGCIGFSDGRPRFELVGSGRLLEAFMGFLKAEGAAGGMTVRGTSSGGDLRRVATMGRWAVKVIELLYRDAVPALERKEGRARVILAMS